MDTFITPYQNAFIQGRNIIDNILLAHEIFDMLGKKKHHKIGYGALKIDISKAYARVNWNFLKAVLLSINFRDKWIDWIMECVTSVQYSLLINGSPTKTFFSSSASILVNLICFVHLALIRRLRRPLLSFFKLTLFLNLASI